MAKAKNATAMVNVLPENDEREHIADVYCWCEPTISDSDASKGPLIIHNAADCREVIEQATGEQWEAGKGWIRI